MPDTKEGAGRENPGRPSSSPDFVVRRFAANLVRCRKELEASQDEVAWRASLNRTEISSLERALRSPRIETVLKLSGALEVSPGDLFEGLGWKPGRYIAGRFHELPPHGSAGAQGVKG